MVKIDAGEYRKPVYCRQDGKYFAETNKMVKAVTASIWLMLHITRATLGGTCVTADRIFPVVLCYRVALRRAFAFQAQEASDMVQQASPSYAASARASQSVQLHIALRRHPRRPRQ